VRTGTQRTRILGRRQEGGKGEVSMCELLSGADEQLRGTNKAVMTRTAMHPLKILAVVGAAFLMRGLLFAYASSPAQAATLTVNSAGPAATTGSPAAARTASMAVRAPIEPPTTTPRRGILGRTSHKHGNRPSLRPALGRRQRKHTPLRRPRKYQGTAEASFGETSDTAPGRYGADRPLVRVSRRTRLNTKLCAT
jgi:hypothetical protein